MSISAAPTSSAFSTTAPCNWASTSASAGEVQALRDTGSAVMVTFNDGSEQAFALVFGADGVHSKVRRLVFGEEAQFARFLGGYVAAFHLDHHSFDIGRALKLYEEANRSLRSTRSMPPPGQRPMPSATTETRVPQEQRLAFVRGEFEGAGWIAEDMLKVYQDNKPIYFDSLTQIVMPEWSKGRVALVGDACGCLTLLAGQGSHMAMAGGYVIARELEQHDGDYQRAFAAYEAKLKPGVTARQNDAASFARYFIPSDRSRPWLRRLVIKMMFSPLMLPLVFRWFGARSVLQGYS